MTPGHDSWRLAQLALAVLALDPVGLGGAIIRMRASPQRDALLQGLALPLPQRRLHPSISDEHLFGGLDIAATLQSGHQIRFDGVISAPHALILTMAERCPTTLAGKLALMLDQTDMHCLIALDEGASADEACPAALADRAAFHITFDGRQPDDMGAPMPVDSSVDPKEVSVPAAARDSLTALALRLGIDSMRAPLLAVRAARAHAALHGRSEVIAADLDAAAALVLAPRATQMPQEQDETAEPPSPPPETETDAGTTSQPTDLPDGDMRVDAIQARLPGDILRQLIPTGTTRRAAGTGTGQKRKSNRRGRPLAPTPGRLDGTTRLDLVATLRAAAPWQPLRQKHRPDHQGLHIRVGDLRMKRYQERSDRLLIFVVDASGSAAVSRLNEAKGAIELMLAQAYATRDHVSLIAFRGTEAEVLLDPTKSLVRTKKQLAALPGGGGTPLASGLRAAAEMVATGRSKGLTPSVVLITDGRANVALDGQGNRAQAAADAEDWGGVIARLSVPVINIDMSKRPHPALKSLADVMGAGYLALPHADANRLSEAVAATLESA